MEALTLLRRLAEQHEYQALYTACLDLAPDLPAVRILLALACFRLGDEASGARILDSVDRSRLDIAARVDLAAVAIARNDLNEAERILERERAAALCGDSRTGALLLARLAWCRMQQGERDTALALYLESLALEPLLAVYHSVLRIFRDEGRSDELERCLEAACQFWKDESRHWPESLRRGHEHQLQSVQLALWLAQDRLQQAEGWLESQRDCMDEVQWCALLIEWSEQLARHDRHAQADEWLRAGLQRYPLNLALHRQLAELAWVQSRSQQALALLRKAERLAPVADPARVEICLRISEIALHGNLRLARSAVEQARVRLDRLALDTGAALALKVELALADVEARERSFVDAEARYRRLLGQQPGLIPALEGLGRLCLHLGRLDEAIARFEQVADLDPGRGHAALIQARQYPQNEASLERLEQFARRPGMEGSVRSGLLLQLAAAWDQRARYDRAFALAEEANTASRQRLRYDPQVHRQRCARIRYAFSRPLFDRRGDSGLETRLPVFVVGMPRSGTTLVEQILAGHSRVHGAGELGTIPQVIAGLERWERFTGSGRCYPDCVDDIDPHVLKGIAARVLEELRDYAPDADHVVDKLPHNFQNIGLIKLLFPGARIISVRRDPRDIAVSNYLTDFAAKQGGMGFAYDLEWIGEQLADHNLLMHHWQQLFGDDILEVQYEALLDDPEATARRLLSHLGIAWEPEVLQFHTLDRPVQTASVWQVRQPLYTSSRGRWKNYSKHLEPLLAGTNRPIKWNRIEMVTLPEPGWLNQGVDRYRGGDLDGAEHRFKQLLHYLPEHAAAQFMLGLVYHDKGYRDDAIRLMRRALERCPWNLRWRGDLARAYRLAGRDRDADGLDPDPMPTPVQRDTVQGHLNLSESLWMARQDA